MILRGFAAVFGTLLLLSLVTVAPSARAQSETGGGFVSTCQDMPVTVGSGKARTESREIRNVRQVKVYGIGKVTLTEGDSETLSIEADDNLLPLLRSEVRNGVLYLGPKEPYRIEPKKEIRYKLQVKRGSVEKIALSGAVEGEAKSWNADRMTLETSGASRLTVDRLYARTLNAQMSGAGAVRIKDGTVGEHRLEVSGSGRYDAFGLNTRDTRVAASGAVRVGVRAENSLRIDASGASEIEYAGKADVVQSLSGACIVRRRD